MLDVKFIRENEAAVREALRQRHSPAPVDDVLQLDRERREALQQAE